MKKFELKIFVTIVLLSSILMVAPSESMACPCPPCYSGTYPDCTYDCGTGDCCGGSCCDNDCCDDVCCDSGTPRCNEYTGECRECVGDEDCDDCYKCSLGECEHNCDNCHWPRYCDAQGCLCVACSDDFKSCDATMCLECVGGECESFCPEGQSCCDGNGDCCDPGGDCAVTDEGMGFDEDDCVSDAAGMGQCRGGGDDIAAYDQTSVGPDASGSCTVDVNYCAAVLYVKCKNQWLAPGEWDCIPDLPPESDFFGTRAVCP